MQECKGLVVGGPLDGTMLTYSANLYRHHILKDVEPILQNYDFASTPEPIADTTFPYIFVTRYWTPYNPRKGVPSLADILDDLDRGYTAAKQKERD